ncbi:MAG: hypothetical protein Q8O26_17775 [Phreatobacter sp.]|uniref:hypothetical protein n=1 Tax=Phreatobacter sp. TaxID=1966341 RepID=UPI0027356287|nr:hypothetical protein [Phreatobacter sp.]MDP2803723.1 hypothetical protein [Phreatobacter sp.]
MRNLFVLMFMLAATVFTEAFMVVVVATPSLNDQGMSTIPVAAGLGVALAIPVAWLAARAISQASKPV